MATQRKVIQPRFDTDEIKAKFNTKNVKLEQVFLMYKQTTDRSPATACT